SAFSYEGLINQLEYAEFTAEQCKYAADNCGADWNEQAAKAAKSYLDYSSFSKDGLIEMLEYEGFTKEQALYGAKENGFN
ncbi:MAG: Ltp family lipoprotein, partial [Clostridia bacterium]|nr:Ltp family lipoprotein [Clostridia bacterium]